MSRKTMTIAAGILLCLCLSHSRKPADTHAELLSHDQLKGCRVHVVGIYSPKDHSHDDRVYVQVKTTEEPIVLVMTGYFGAQWNVTIEDGADVRQIIVPGYYEHSIVGAPESVPLELITYFPKADKSRSDYFWAYSWHTAQGRQLRSRVKELTGLEIATFQGEYAGNRFVVDGKRGDVSELEEPRAVASQPDSETQSVGARRLVAAAQHAKLKRQSMLAQYGKDHPLIKQIDMQLEMIEAEMSRNGISASTPSASDEQTTSTGNPDVMLSETDQRKVIEALVRQSFELEIELQNARVAKAEADLRRVKQQLAERKQRAETIIKNRINELLRDGFASTSKEALPETRDDVPASVLSSQGWDLWRKHDWPGALAKFDAAVKKDPEFEAARNGRGWTLVHLGEYDKAIAEFRKLLEKNPTHPAALNGIGQCLLAQGKLQEAEKELLEATESVIEGFGEATAVRKGMTASWAGLVETYLRAGDSEKAKKWINRYLKYKPDDSHMKELLKRAELIERESE